MNTLEQVNSSVVTSSGLNTSMHSLVAGRIGATRRVNPIAATAALLICAACGGSKTFTPTAPTGSPTTTAGSGATPGTGVFSQSPLDVSVISTIVPIGNLNPPDHTLPTNHSYFFHPSTADAEVRAPAAGTVGTVQRGSDDQIYVTVSSGFDYYIAHVRLDAGIGQGSRVSAGQRLGVTASAAGAMDLGVINNAITLFFVRPERYIAGTLHGDSPLKYFAEPLRNDLYSKVSRIGGDKDGRIDFDQAGRLAGNWFAPDLPPSATENFGNGPKQLAFARDVNDPSLVRISIGGTLSVSGAFYVQAGAPDPAGVSVDTGKVGYQLYFTPQAQLPAGTLIVALLADDRIRVETFAGNAPLSIDFTSNALTYIR